MGRTEWDAASGRPVRSIVFGDPAPDVSDLVIVPGLGACGYLLPLARACGSWSRVHLLDVPGFGDRRTARCPSTLDDVSMVMTQWVRRRAGSPVNLFGHSTGA